MKPEDAFKPGPAQDQVLKGIASHGFDSHPRDSYGLTRSQYAERARNDLVKADRAIAFRQGVGEHAVFGNTKSGMAGWINTTNPSRSTYFKPELGVTRYISGRETRLRNLGQAPRRIDLQRIRSGPSISNAQPRSLAPVKSAPGRATQLAKGTAPIPSASMSKPTAPKTPIPKSTAPTPRPSVPKSPMPRPAVGPQRPAAPVRGPAPRR